MNLTLDIGNTHTKILIFDDTNPVYRKVMKDVSVSELKKIIKNYPIDGCMYSSVKKLKPEITRVLKQIPGLTSFSGKLPIRNKYKTPATLGNDRLANAIAGRFLFPLNNVLIIDVGTCIKYDFVSEKGEYLGGSISPGLDMRFKALHAFTDKLPIVKYAKPKTLIGNSTQTAMQTGVIIGMKEEIRGFVRQYESWFKNLKIILTGGDAERFVNDLNLSIFAAADLVNNGLNEVIRFNAKSGLK